MHRPCQLIECRPAKSTAGRHSYRRRIGIAVATALTLPSWTRRSFARAATAPRPEGVRRLLASAAEQVRVTKGYDPRYVVLAYPMGDVAADTGVCTDVLIRAFRHAGVDLQKEVHEDMRARFAAYPTRWGLSRPDPNIDHRRVPNLQVFLERRGKSLPLSADASRYRPGDIVAWHLDARGTTHIGLVAEAWNAATRRHSIVHNIGEGTKQEDRLFDWKVAGHYRWFG